MKLSVLLKNDDVLGSNVGFDIDISGIWSDSRKVEKNGAFVAIMGEARNGNDYAYEAIERGASVVITDENGAEKNIPCVWVKNARSAISKMYARFYGLPDENAKVIAVTGTNGKSTVAYFIYNILASAGKSVGLISTVECLINGERVDLDGGGAVSDKASAMTTPDPEKLYCLLGEMKKRSVEYVILETSSHALDQSRLDGINIDFAVFTNLSSEHLDYHKTMENYFLSKELLFKKARVGIVNIDDEYGKRLYASHKNIYSFSAKEKADFSASEIKCADGYTRFAFDSCDRIEIKTKMTGEYNAYNASLACAVGSLLDIPREKICEGILKTQVKGRVEKFADNAYIDYAHTPKATEAVLSAIKKAEGNKKITVLFGCGGERDKTKRAQIGKIASRLADKLVITSDNSRGEEPIDIIKDVLAGVDRQKLHMIIPNRRDAIIYAARTLKENEVLVLLGKGHETYEIDKKGKHFFDERVILSEVLGNDKYKAEDSE
ncbi:MAG: UDP-N-acetylmuramoyl-L-alanyl-D-glutamate--2,6-diaminopimelate ligase [Clostridia bacterium]|nr:UDP-N-acetylmuramoyl-L-alanyl-D-glutamate--2,6-diaminopimelate ligase [Clostridia bacterium]